MRLIYIKGLTALSLMGAILVSMGNPLCANLAWSISNPLLAVHNYTLRQKEQALLFSAFAVIAWFGVIFHILIYYF